MSTFYFGAGHLAKGLPVSATIGFVLVIGGIALQAGTSSVVTSPSGRIKASIEMPAPGSTNSPWWSATFRGKTILTQCRLGLQMADSGNLMAGVRVVRERRRSVDKRIPVLFGKADHANDRFHEIRYTLETPQGRRTDAV